MRRQLLSAILMVLSLTVVTGVVYPLVVTGVSQVAFHSKANGSFVTVNGKRVGSKLIGQSFTDEKYFHPRPSAAGTDGYDATASAATNLGPSNQKLLDAVSAAAVAYRQDNNLAADAKVPSDAVTSSASGLDPEISIDNARLQAPRVATQRGLPVAAVLRLVNKYTEDRSLGVLGDPGVNVFELNLALNSGKQE